MSDIAKDVGFQNWEAQIPGELPCGEDLSFEPEFEQLGSEVGKDTSIHGDQKTNWVVVHELADLLLKRSKDIWFFAYGAIAVHYTRGVADCAQCIKSLNSILSTQWTNLHPSLHRPKRREAPLKWLCNKFHHISSSTAFIGARPNDVMALNAAFGELQDTLDTLLPDNALTFKSILRSKIEGSSEISTGTGTGIGTGIGPPNNIAAPKQTAVVHSQEAPLAQNTSGQPEKRSTISASTLPQVIRAINDNTRQLGDHLLALNREDERAYHLHRVALWGTLLQLPPSEVSGLTQLTCPIPMEVITMYTNAVHDNRHGEILSQIERDASNAPFWLDGQYLVVLCLEGISATSVAFSVKHSIAQLIQRFPDILNLKFKDGMPFASNKTATWINSFASSILIDAPHAVNGQQIVNSAHLPDEHAMLQEAIELSVKGNFKAGLEILGVIPPGKSRGFMRQSVLKAKYCIAVGQLEAASQLLKAVIDKLRAWDLLDWEPELSAEAIKLFQSLTAKRKGVDSELQAILHFLSLETALANK